MVGTSHHAIANEEGSFQSKRTGRDPVPYNATLLLFSFDYDGATDDAIDCTEALYPLTSPRKMMEGGTTISLSLRNINRDEERPLVKISAT